MVWFAVMRALSGAVIGWLFVPVLGIAISSSQIVFLLVALWLAEQVTLWELLLWAFATLMSHQSAYLVGLLLRECLWGVKESSTPRVVVEVENELVLLDSLAQRIEAKAPHVQDEARDLSCLVARLRRILVVDRAEGEGLRGRNHLSVC